MRRVDGRKRFAKQAAHAAASSYGICKSEYVRERTEKIGVARDHAHTRHSTRPVVPAGYAKRDAIMLYTIAVILVILWLLGLVTSYTLGGFIHILLVVAIIAILLRVINGRTPL